MLRATYQAMTFLKYFRLLIVTFLFVLMGNQSSWAAQANFSWLPNDPSDGTVGYMIHYGTSSRNYFDSIDVGSPVPINGRVYASVFDLPPNTTYYFTVTAYNATGQESSFPNEVACTTPSDTVNSTQYDIYMSTSSTLSGAATLDGATVDGDIYVFTGPDDGVSLVTFSVDGAFARTEAYAPFELDGGAAYDTSQLSPGQHEISAEIKLTDGSTREVSGVFTIPSADGIPVNPSSYDILVTTSPNLTGTVPLDGATVDGDIYVLTGPDTGVTSVTFSVDGVLARTEAVAPFELAGGAAFDASQLSSGAHEITAKLQLTDGTTETISAAFTIPSADGGTVSDDLHDIFVSTSKNLTGATLLEGATVDGDIYVFTGPDTGVSSVVFSVDGVYARTENHAPFELSGGAAFASSKKLSPGSHEITAGIKLTDGSTEVVSAIFTIPFASDSRCDLLFAERDDLAGAKALEGATVNGDIYVFTGPDTGVTSVTFSVDGVVARTEAHAPFELAGGAAYNTSQLAAGKHQVTASIQFNDGTSELIGAAFIVQ